jgi:hypothetical protein
MEAEMPDGADVAEKTPPAGRYLIIATLVVWALGVVGAPAAIDTYPSGIVTLLVLASLVAVTLVVVGAALALDRYPRSATLVLAPVIGSVVLALVLLLIILTFSATEPSDPDAGTNLIFAVLTLLVLAFVAVGEAKLIRREPIVGTLGLALGVVVVVVGLFFLRNALRSEPIDAAYAYPPCSPENLESLAEMFGTQPTTEAVARAYVPWARTHGYSGTYADCLQGFRERR